MIKKQVIALGVNLLLQENNVKKSVLKDVILIIRIVIKIIKPVSYVFKAFMEMNVIIIVHLRVWKDVKRKEEFAMVV